MTREKRFEDTRRLIHKGKTTPGPSDYDILSTIERRKSAKPCTRLMKPELLDESLYEYVSGMTKILKVSNMKPKKQALHEAAVNEFASLGSGGYCGDLKVRRKISDAFIH